MPDKLISEIQKIDAFSEEETDMLLGFLTKRCILKGDHFLNRDQISRHIAYVDAGMMMHYSLHDGLEIPCNFSSEGEWMGNLKSFSSGGPAEVAIKALEDTWIREISATDMQQLFTASSRWRLFQNHMVQLVFLTWHSTMQILPRWMPNNGIISLCGTSPACSTGFLNIILRPILVSNRNR